MPETRRRALISECESTGTKSALDFTAALGEEESERENVVKDACSSRTPEVARGGRFSGKRVAVVVFSHYPSDPRPRREAETLAELGMQVEVISLAQSDGEARREVSKGIKVLRLGIRRRRGGKFAYLYQYASFILASFFLLAIRSLTRRYSLVHVHNMPDILVFSALVPKMLGAKVILDQHDPMPELMMTIFGMAEESRGVRLLKQLEKLSLRFADKVLVVNEACKRIFSKRSCPASKLQVVMNAPDETIFSFREESYEVESKRNPTKPFVIMYHGSLVERHGLDLAVAALRAARRTIPGAELRIYGQSTPFLEKVMSEVSAAGLEKAVRYFGPKDLEGVAEEIRQCDVGVIPNRRSIFTEINTPTRIFEYLSQGKPVITPAAPGILDYFGPEDLIFFELGDANDLARKLEYVFTHSEEVRQIVKRGQQVYLAHKWSSERARFLTVLEGLLIGSNRTALKAKPSGYSTAINPG